VVIIVVERQHACSEELRACSAIHRTFDRLQRQIFVSATIWLKDIGGFDDSSTANEALRLFS